MAIHAGTARRGNGPSEMTPVAPLVPAYFYFCCDLGGFAFLERSTAYFGFIRMNPLPENLSTLPIIQPFSRAPDALDVFRCLSDKPHCLFLDSALRHQSLGRFSFVTADPFEVIQVAADGSDAIGELQRRMGSFCTQRVAGLPPFQGGAAGLFGYELARSLERLPTPRWDEFNVPALAVGLYDVVIAFDHRTNEAWIISQGFPETDPDRRRRRADARLNEFREWLSAAPSAPRKCRDSRIALEAPFVESSRLPNVGSNFRKEDYLAVVKATIEYIRAGDVFQVNLAQRLIHAAEDHAVDLYCRLRERTPATFSGYFDTGPYQIVSASPERFVRVDARQVETRPIKGTRPRTARPEADLYAADELRGDEKERAENVMIVDLLRNDLSVVCEPASVKVTQLCGLEQYGYVQHLVSAVEGTLSAEQGTFDLLRAAFPGGSVTGAPKIRAMEIINELEQTARGAYCGSLGYVGWDGGADLNILIRTITAGRGWWQLPVGGGITCRSDPRREYEETWHKAAGLLRALYP